MICSRDELKRRSLSCFGPALGFRFEGGVDSFKKNYDGLSHSILINYI